MTPTSSPGDRLDAADGHLVDERLVDLVLGEEPEGAERAHLDGCTRCSTGLASLGRTVQTTRGSAAIDLVTPPQQVWAGIEEELGDEATSLPEVVPLRRAVRSEPTRASRRRPAPGWLVAACAAGALLGAGGVVAADRLQGGGTDPARTVATAELDTLDTGQRLGTAAVSERAGGVSLRVSAGEIDAGGEGYVEVWLLNRDGRRLVSVGVLGDGVQAATFPISQRLLDEGYVVVDLSREQFDDRPQHSGDSIVRGSLTTSA